MKREVMTFVLMLVVMGMVVGQSNAFFKDFKNCMKTCLIDCVIPPWMAACPARCLAKCIIHPLAATATIAQRSHQFCTFGCASSKCSNIISKDNYRLEAVESCVDGCSQTCMISDQN